MSQGSTDRESGSALWVAWPGLAFTALVLILVVDLAAYLVAVERARSAAELAALAAASAEHPDALRRDGPRAWAGRVARANGADLVACSCRRGSPDVTVTVSVDVRAVAVTRFAGRRIEATARATLHGSSRAAAPSGHHLRIAHRRYPSGATSRSFARSSVRYDVA